MLIFGFKFQLPFEKFQKVSILVGHIDVLHQGRLSDPLLRVLFTVGVKGAGQLSKDRLNGLTDAFVVRCLWRGPSFLALSDAFGFGTLKGHVFFEKTLMDGFNLWIGEGFIQDIFLIRGCRHEVVDLLTQGRHLKVIADLAVFVIERFEMIGTALVDQRLKEVQNQTRELVSITLPEAVIVHGPIELLCQFFLCVDKTLNEGHEDQRPLLVMMRNGLVPSFKKPFLLIDFVDEATELPMGTALGLFFRVGVKGDDR